MKASKGICRRPPLATIGFILFTVTFWFAGIKGAVAVDACGEPTGSLSITLLSNSDTYVSIPFTRPPEYCGTVQSVSNGPVFAITVEGASGWADGQWAIPSTPNSDFPYYVVVTSGNKEGATFTITTNSADTVTVTTNSANSLTVTGCDDLSGVNAGDRLAIIPYWTLGTVFPGGTGVVATTSIMAYKTELFFLDHRRYSGIAGGAQYYFYNSHWRESGASSTRSYDDATITPDNFFIARQQNNSTTTTFTAAGSIVQYAARICLHEPETTIPGFTGDNYVANYHSTTQTLDQSNLAAAIAASDPGASPPAIYDLVYVYDNTAMKRNKTPAHIYFFNVDHWADLNNPPYTVDRGGDPVFIPGTGVNIRRRTGSSLSVWVDPP